MSFKSRCCSFLCCVVLLYRSHKVHGYVDACEQPNSAVYCTCEPKNSETTVTCFVFGNLSRTDPFWNALSSVENAAALTLHSRLPTRHDYVPSETLREMPYLQSLALKEGNLGQLEENSISDLPSLRKLMLERNEITGLEHHAIFNLPRLKKLALSENLLNEVLAESMAGLDELEQLFLDANNISRIENCAFCNLQNLKELELWGNQITDLNEHIFRGLRFLKRLDLYKNKIRLLNDKVFHSMPRLLEIDLRDNLIEYIAPRAFRGLEKLQKLMLNQNRLKRLPNQVFKGLPDLRFVDLFANQLEVLQVEVVQNMAHVNDEHFSFSFRENPLKCDCHLHWVHIYVKLSKSHQFTKELHDLRCLNKHNVTQHVSLLKLDCDKTASDASSVILVTPSSVMSPKAKQRSFNGSSSMKSSEDEDSDDASAIDEYFGDVNYSSSANFHTLDIKVIMLTAVLFFMGHRNSHRQS